MSCCCDWCCCCRDELDLDFEFEQSNADCFGTPPEPLTPEQRAIVRDAWNGLAERLRLAERAEAMQRAIS